MASRHPSGIKRVTLCIGRHVYTSEVCQESESSWILLRVDVHKVGVAGSIDFHGKSCIEVLRQGESLALEMIAASQSPEG